MKKSVLVKYVNIIRNQSIMIIIIHLLHYVYMQLLVLFFSFFVSFFSVLWVHFSFYRCRQEKHYFLLNPPFGSFSSTHKHNCCTHCTAKNTIYFLELYACKKYKVETYIVLTTLKKIFFVHVLRLKKTMYCKILAFLWCYSKIFILNTTGKMLYMWAFGGPCNSNRF